MSTIQDQISPLPLSLLKLKGVNATAFLQNYITADITDTADDKVTLAACCTRQGRTVTDLDIIQTQQDLYLCLHQDMVAPLLEHLTPYLRLSRLTLAVLDNWQAYCLRKRPTTAEDWVAVSNCQATKHKLLVQLPYIADWLLCWLDTSSVSSNLLEANLDPIEETEWQRLECRSGRVRVTPVITGRFLPQTLGYEQLQGISYSKGCYLGQEIVTRTHYRGKVKSNLRKLTCKVVPAVGTDITDDEDRKVGTVVSVAETKDHSELLAILSGRLSLETNLRLNHTQTSLHPLE